jgi:hypothetical protein
MKNDWEYTLYVVADRLHTPIYRLKAEMPMKEFVGWIKYINGPVEKPVDLANISRDELERLFG